MFSAVIEEFASKTPNAPFAVDNSAQVSYAEAVSISRRVSTWIQSQPFFNISQPIFTYFEVKAEYLPVILGVMQSGMPWVGLDPDFPMGHNQNLLNLVEEPNIISPKENQYNASQLSRKIQLLPLEEILLSESTQPTFVPCPSSTALMIFTSGSTQNPKGVMRSHKDLFENAIAQANAFHLKPSDCITAGYSPNVMGFLRAFFNIIAVGGCYRPFQFKGSDGDSLFNALKSPEPNILHIVAPVFRAIFATLVNAEKFENINKVILGGDAATPEDFDLFCQYFPEHSQIFSGLGSSESGTISVWKGDQDYLPEREKLPCGIIVPSATVLFDIDGDIRKPVENEIGEVLVCSSGVAQKYWNNENLTEQAWVTLSDGKKYYRTGDLASFDEMGNLHHFGRADSAAKINGFFVDPAAVEFVLSQHSNVKEAAVEIDMESHNGKPVVEAFLVLKTEFNRTDLRAYINANLLNSARPTLLYQMQELPRTKTGKLMRSSLDRSQPFSIRIATKRDSRPDLDRLRSIWSKVLEQDDINDEDNFLALGGNSLNLIILTLEIEQEFSLRFSVEDISSALSLYDMSKTITHNSAVKTRIESNLESEVNLKIGSFVSNTLSALKGKITNVIDGVSSNAIQPVDLISSTLSTWKGLQIEDSGLIRKMNKSGFTPLYWCLQNEREFQALSNALEHKITLNALRSLNLLVKRTPEKLNTIAEAYANAILSAHGHSNLPLNLGGNCQGSALMLRVAKIIQSKGVKINHFIMMEKFFDEPIVFPITMLFGKNSERNLYRSGELTFEYAKKTYAKLQGIYEINGQHGQFFSKRNIESLSTRILMALDLQ